MSNDNDAGCGAVIFFSLCTFLIGLGIGISISSICLKEEALRNNVAQYNQYTGRFEFKKLEK